PSPSALDAGTELISPTRPTVVLERQDRQRRRTDIRGLNRRPRQVHLPTTIRRLNGSQMMHESVHHATGRAFLPYQGKGEVAVGMRRLRMESGLRVQLLVPEEENRRQLAQQSLLCLRINAEGSFLSMADGSHGKELLMARHAVLFAGMAHERFAGLG